MESELILLKKTLALLNARINELEEKTKFLEYNTTNYTTFGKALTIPMIQKKDNTITEYASSDFNNNDKLYGLSMNSILLQLKPCATYDLYIVSRLIFLFSKDYNSIIDNTWFYLYWHILDDKLNERNLTKLIYTIVKNDAHNEFVDTQLGFICQNDKIEELDLIIKHSLNLASYIDEIMTIKYSEKYQQTLGNVTSPSFDDCYLNKYTQYSFKDSELIEDTIKAILRFGNINQNNIVTNCFKSYPVINPVSFMMHLHGEITATKNLQLNSLPLKWVNNANTPYNTSYTFELDEENGNNSYFTNTAVKINGNPIKLSEIMDVNDDTDVGVYRYIKILYANAIYYLFGDVDSSLIDQQHGILTTQ